MVFFTCNNCGNSIKKNQVSAHKFKCRNGSVSCIDCGKDFWGSDYEAHVQCISEAEKYSAKGSVPNVKVNKAQQRQEEFTDCLHQILKTEKLKPNVRSMIQELATFTNVPQKKTKFENYVKQTLSLRSPQLITELWNIISTNVEKLKVSKVEEKLTENSNGIDKSDKLKKEKKQKKTAENSTKENISVENVDENEVPNTTDETNQRKRKKTGEKDEETNKKIKVDNDEPVEDEKSEKFKWKKAMILVLEERDDKEISYKKLCKKITAQYKSHRNGANSLTKEEIKNMVSKKIASSSRLVLEQERVTLNKST